MSKILLINDPAAELTSYGNREIAVQDIKTPV